MVKREMLQGVVAEAKIERPIRGDGGGCMQEDKVTSLSSARRGKEVLHGEGGSNENGGLHGNLVILFRWVPKS